MALLDPTIVTLAASQHGLIMTRQLERMGVSRLVLSGWCRHGVLERYLRGVYAVTEVVRPAPGAGEEVVKHLLRCRAAQLLYPDATLASTSAVLAHGLPVWGSSLSIPIIRRPVNRGRGVTGLRVRRTTGVSVPTRYGPAAPVARALAEHAAECGIVQGVVSADAALHRGLVSEAELAKHVSSLSVRWSSRPKAMVKLVDARSESVGESRLRCMLAFDGWELEPQTEIRDRSGHVFARVDGVLKGTKIAVEFDGLVKYAEGNPAALIAEKRREDRLRAHGWIVVRVEWRDLEEPRRLFGKIRAALAAAAASAA